MILNGIAAGLVWLVFFDGLYRFNQHYKQLAHVTIRVYDPSYMKQLIGIILMGIALVSILAGIRFTEVSDWLTIAALGGGYAASVFHYFRPYGMDEDLLVYKDAVYALHTLEIVASENQSEQYIRVNLVETIPSDKGKMDKHFKLKLLVDMDQFRQFEHLLNNSRNRVAS